MAVVSTSSPPRTARAAAYSSRQPSAHRRVRAGQGSCRGGRQTLVVRVGGVGDPRGVRAGAKRGWWDGSSRSRAVSTAGTSAVQAAGAASTRRCSTIACPSAPVVSAAANAAASSGPASAASSCAARRCVRITSHARRLAGRAERGLRERRRPRVSSLAGSSWAQHEELPGPSAGSRPRSTAPDPPLGSPTRRAGPRPRTAADKPPRRRRGAGCCRCPATEHRALPRPGLSGADRRAPGEGRPAARSLRCGAARSEMAALRARNSCRKRL